MCIIPLQAATHELATNMQTHMHTKISASMTARPPLLVCAWVQHHNIDILDYFHL